MHNGIRGKAVVIMLLAFCFVQAPGSAAQAGRDVEGPRKVICESADDCRIMMRWWWLMFWL